MFNFIIGKPTINELADHGIINDVKHRWRELGTVLGQANELDGYMAKALFNFHTCCTYVLQAWVDNAGTGKYPLSWQGLYDALCTKDVQCKGPAESMIQKVGLGLYDCP